MVRPRHDPAASQPAVPLQRLSFSSDSSSGRQVADDDHNPEREPLIQPAPSSSSSSSPRAASLLRQPASPGSSSQNTPRFPPRPSDDDYNYDVQYGDVQPFLRPYSPAVVAEMEKVKSSRVAHYANKLAVENEPGLTNTQLLLTNYDLKPVEPERRQWGAWNFVGFWVGGSSFSFSACH